MLLALSFALWWVTPFAPHVVFSGAAITLAWGIFIERHWVEQTERVVALAGLPASMDGFRILHLTDIHFDDRTNVARLCAMLDRFNRLEPDMVVLTGDLITHFRRHIEPCAQVLGRLRARRGVYAVLGNHDHWANGRAMAEALRHQGIRVLCNEHELIDGGFWLVGVDDPHLHFDDLDAALDGIDEDGRPRVLLAHSPDIMSVAVDRVDVVLTGHTHGGQVRLPVVGPLMRATRREAARRHVMGLKRIGRTLCFTNRGLGTVLIPIRFNCRPEVAVVTLRPAPKTV